MGARYHVYIVRHWVFPDGQERAEVRRDTADTPYRCRSLAAATAWIQAQGQPQAASGTAPPRDRAAGDEEGHGGRDPEGTGRA